MGAVQENLVLSVAIGGVPGEPRQVIDSLATSGWRGVQLDARTAGTRPHELGDSARRDLASLLRRRQLLLTGIDLWLPEGAFADPSVQERAVDRTIECICLAADLGGCAVSTVLPEPESHAQLLPAIEAVLAAAGARGVRIADCSRGASSVSALRPHVHALGLDPATLLAGGEDPVAAAHAWGSRLAGARFDDISPTGMRVPPSLDGGGRLDVMGYKVALSLGGLDFGGGVVVDLRQCSDPAAALLQARSAWESIS